YFSDKVEILLADYGTKNMNDTTLMKELKEEYDNLTYYYYGDKELELNQIKNRLLSEVKSEFITFVEPQNQLSVVKLKEKLDIVISKSNTELLISDEKFGQNFEKDQNESLISQISKLNGNIGRLIFSHSFLMQNRIEFSEELKTEEIPFLIKVLKTVTNIEFSKKDRKSVV